MRAAIVTDIHGNLEVLSAVLADTGANPVEVVDLIRPLGWQGVMGNTDEMLFRSPALGKERVRWLASQPRVMLWI